MNTIGFSINSASAGARRIITCNDGPWSGSVVDIREYLKFFPAAFAEGQCIPYLTFDAEGCFITILRSIPGRVGDFLAGWLYVPNNIIVSGEELVSHIEFVKQVLHQTNLGSVKGSIDERFSQVYPESPAPRSFVSGGEKYGIRNPFAQGFSLAAILGNRHQDYYRNYKAIFLADASFLANEYYQRFDNLTGQPLATYVNVQPPVQPAGHFGQGVQIFLADGRTRFKAPVRVAAGEPFTIIVRRPGFAEKRFTFKNVRDGHPLNISGCSNEWSMRIERSNFNIVDENGRPVFNPQIAVNGIPLQGHITIDEGDCGNAMIEVSAPGYRSYSMPHNFLNKFDGIRIMLSSTSGAGASRPAGGAGRVNYSVNNSSKGGGSSFMYGLIAGLAVLVIGGGSYFLLKNDGTESNDDDTEIITDGGGEGEKDNAGLRNYLTNHDKITRDAMEAIGAVQLFEDLNTYNYDAIVNTWGDLLEQTGHGDVVANVKNRKRAPSAPYCNDGEITLSRYADHLIHEPKQDNNNNSNSNGASNTGSSNGGNRNNGASSGGSSNGGNRNNGASSGGSSNGGNRNNGASGGGSSNGGSRGNGGSSGSGNSGSGGNSSGNTGNKYN